MSQLLQFEKNIELGCVAFLKANNLSAARSRESENLPVDNIQIMFEYGGALEETRQHLAGHFEFNAHQGLLQMTVSTFRDSESDHNERLGAVRKLLLHHNNGLSVEHYNFLDLQPQGSQYTELEEQNIDSTVLLYLLRYEIDLSYI